MTSNIRLKLEIFLQVIASFSASKLKIKNSFSLERSKLARSIRAPQSPQGDAVSSDEESQTDQKHEPRILSKKKSDHALPKFRKELNP